ncbi:hypothetical protein [Novosphingobium sp. PhB165]|uniref:hypothetical protein n=1 Tax=Novosphingobium sp. PhB165 TaxID=2485105 RepID=UPI001042980F|nr:hypothetical protein [Novosphingobium sp. PhB165]
MAILRIGWSGLSWLRDTAKRYPWQVALIVALALCWWLWSGKTDALNQRDAAKTELAGARADWAKQVAAAKAATASAEHKSQEIAQDAQTTHDALLADNAGLRYYIAAHRVRQSAGTSAAAPAEGDGAEVHAESADAALVAVSEADLTACDASYVYARSAHEWAQGLIAQDLAQAAK